jgi:hypothetical protein
MAETEELIKKIINESEYYAILGIFEKQALRPKPHPLILFSCSLLSLGVEKDAQDSVIMKSYRKLALRLHPGELCHHPISPITTAKLPLHFGSMLLRVVARQVLTATRRGCV